MTNKEILTLLDKARKGGVQIVLRDGKLVVGTSKRQVVDRNLINELKQNKEVLRNFLDSEGDLLPQRTKAPRITRQKVDRIPLSFSQERLWFIDRYEGSNHYHVPRIMELDAISEESLIYAFRSVIKRHEILRTIYKEDGGVPYQESIDASQWKLGRHDGTGLDSQSLSDKVRTLMNRPFDLIRDYMLKADLISLENGGNILLIVVHHIATDGWSDQILTEELFAYYESHLSSQPDPYEPLPIQYADYAVWQRSYLKGSVLEQKVDYWRDLLFGVAPLNLPMDYPRPVQQSAKGTLSTYRIGDATAKKSIYSLVETSGASAFMILLSVFKVLMHRYSGQTDICIGIPIANRNHTDLEQLIGFFVNTLALRSDLSGNPSFDQLLRQVKERTIDAYANQDVPFEKIVEALVEDRDLSRSPLFQVMFVLQNPSKSESDTSGETGIDTNLITDTSKYDLSFILQEDNDGFSLSVEYSTDLYAATTIDRMVEHYESLLYDILTDTADRIGNLSMLGDVEINRLVRGFNQTDLQLDSGNVLDLFSKSAANDPDQTALILGNAEMSYGELDHRSSCVARYLIAQGVVKETMVGLLVDRSFDMVVAVLGILKAGGAYVPIDPKYPKERVQYILDDSDLDYLLQDVITSRSFLPPRPVVQLVMDEVDWEETSFDSPISGLDDFCLLIYTSGSTGRPKGVVITHGNVFSFISWSLLEFRDSSFEIVYGATSLSFDLSVFEIFFSLAKGIPLRILKDATAIQDHLSEDTGVLINTVPSVVGSLLKLGIDWAPVSGVNMAGEQVPVNTIQLLDLKGMEVRNLYGPSEDTTYSTGYKLSSSEDIRIGKAIFNTRLYVLDNYKNLVPIGVPGELYIGGAGLSRGYLNRPELTASKFIEHPVAPGERLYQTGDIVKWHEDGVLEFIGREDNQVKVRGHRIELGEIEHTLRQIKSVSQAITIARPTEDGGKQLVGYVVMEAGSSFSQEFITEQLEKKLPAFMVPMFFTELGQIPLTANGKIDYRSLPDVQVTSAETCVVPESEAERQMRGIWSEILDHPEECLSTDANFFRLGGHSLLAVRIIAKVRALFQVELSLVDLFSNPTIQGFTALVPEGQEVAFESIPVQPRTARIPLSFAQERLWFIDRFEGSGHYHIPKILHLGVNVSRSPLRKAFHHLLERHEVLRTVYKEYDGVPYQHVLDPSFWGIREHDGRDLDESSLNDFVDSLTVEAFDLSQDYMLRVDFVALGADEFLMIMVIHHIAFDGWSDAILMEELQRFYSLAESGEELDTPSLPIQYADYSIWQRTFLKGSVLERRLAFWKKHLAYITPLDLPTDFPRPLQQSTNGTRRGYHLGDASLSHALQQLSQSTGASLFMVLSSVFKVLLSRYSGQYDICVGSPIANRAQGELEGMIGFFVNTLALRSDLKGNPGFLELLDQVKSQTLEAYEHQDVPFEKIVEELEVERDMSRSPLFQVMFVLQNNRKASYEDTATLDIEVRSSEHTSSKYDITFSVEERESDFGLTVEYCTDLYTETTIARMVGHYEELLKSVVADPTKGIEELSMLSEHERQYLLSDFKEVTSIDEEESLFGLFQGIVDQGPDRLALLFGDSKMSYGELDEQSNRLARYLQESGVEKGSLLGICLDRSFEMVVGILAILKAGGCYMPIDPSFPDKRINWMVMDSGVNLVLTSESYLPLFSKEEVSTVNVSDAHKIETYSNSPLPSNRSRDSLAYLMYTSGSTGNPKGVLIRDKNILDLVEADPGIQIHKDDCVLQWSNYVFDGSVFDIFCSLTKGASLCLIRKDQVADIHALVDVIEQHQVTVSFLTTALFNALAETDLSRLGSMRKLLFGGEKVSLSHVQRAYNTLGKDKLVHVYGPTEATVYSTFYCVDEYPENAVPIGKGWGASQLLLLNKHLEPVPEGVPGQLYIGGLGVTSGYLNHPQLTEQRLITHPLIPGVPMYYTGDVVKRLEDGNLEFIGREDDQVKVRGYRIELEEISHVLQNLDEISQVLVITRPGEDGSLQLVGFVVMQPDVLFDPGKITETLKRQLPAYMVPIYWMELDQLPLTHNGKVDKKALPAVEAAASETFDEPQTEAERKMQLIWSEVLGIPYASMSVTDNFFRIGGHSIMAVRIVSKIRKVFEVEIPVRELFSNPTVRGLSACLGMGDSVIVPSIEIQERPERIPLSFAQERLWFIDRYEGSTHYHIPMVLRLGSSVSLSALESAFLRLLQRHEVLRTVYKEYDGVPYQEILEASAWKITKLDGQLISEKEFNDLVETRTSTAFDLSHDFMMRVDFIKLDHGELLLVMVIHHIASDGWSDAILIEELQQYYRVAETGINDSLDPLPIQYADYSIWQRAYLTGAVLDQRLAYWRDHLTGVSPLNLPTDYPRPSQQSIRGASRNYDLGDSSVYHALELLSQKTGASLFMVLLSVFKVLLSRYSGQTDICVGSPIANRTQGELEGLIGFFVNTLALRSDLSGNPTFETLLKQVREQTLSAYANQDVPFEKIIEELEIERDLSRSPLFQVMFILQNNREVSADEQLPGIEMEVQSTEQTTSKFDITFAVRANDSDLQLTVEYCTDLYTSTTIDRMMGHFKQLLKSAVNDPSQRISDLVMLDDSERKWLLKEFNKTERNVGPGNVLDLFAKSVQNQPNQVALKFEAHEITYVELDRRANQLARRLQNFGVGKATMVGLYVERSIEMIIGILGIIKAGGSYVPIDPNSPIERVNYIIDDSRLIHLIQDEATANTYEPNAKIRQVLLNLDEPEDQLATDFMAISLETDQFSHLIYTSGSTGYPKGVLVKHSSVYAFLLWCLEEFKHSQFDVVYGVTSLVFDLSIFEVFFSLAAGKPLRILKDANSIELFLRKDSGVLLNTVPSVVSNLLDIGISWETVSVLNMAGEPIPVSTLNRLDLDRMEVRNLYGPSEDTTYTTCYKIASDSDLRIGKPIHNTQLYVLDSYMNLVPVGVAGELYIGGVGLSSGYLNRPELTAEKFIENPFNSGDRLYRTGDIVKWHGDGNLEYLGREDDQVKVRGYRIELYEIEHALRQLEEVAQGVVISRKDDRGIPFLVGYAVMRNNCEFDPDFIIRSLKDKLPSYMVPLSWIEIDDIPLTRNGKVDRKALPAKAIPTANVELPQGDVEERLATIWKSLLNEDQIGRSDNFFALGGHSLMAVKLISLVQKELSVDLSIKDIFMYPTLLELASYLNSKRSN